MTNQLQKTLKQLAESQARTNALLAQMMGSNALQPTKPSRVQAKSTSPRKSTAVTHDADENTIYIQVEQGKRIKLPKRMFGKDGKATVGGVKFHSLASDQGRSAPINAREVFDAEPGDVLVFTRVKGSKWDFEVASDEVEVTPAKAHKPAKAKSTSKAKDTRDPDVQAMWKAAPRFKSTGNAKKDIRKMLNTVAEQVVENYNDPDFVDDADSIRETNSKASWGLEIDPREFLNLAQRNRFRKGCKTLGISMKDACTMLSDMVEIG